jgi:hypothetical protein
MRQMVMLIIAAVAATVFGCATPGGQFTRHNDRGGLDVEGPPSSMPSVRMTDEFAGDEGQPAFPGSWTLHGGIGPSAVEATADGIVAVSTLSQNTATIKLPIDLNGDGDVSEAEANILNFAGSSDLNAEGVTFEHTITYAADGTTVVSRVNSVGITKFSSLNSPIGPSIVAIFSQIMPAYSAASADRRAEFDRYYQMVENNVKNGSLAASDFIAQALRILSPVPMP